MASFLSLGSPFVTPVGQKIEQATDGSLPSENWALNMEICDMINDSSDTARDAMKAIRKRLSQNAGKNNKVIMYTLTVLETCVKNCGKAFHLLVAQKDFINDLIKLIGPKNGPPIELQERVLTLIQIWADAFKNQPDLNGVTQMYMELKNKGFEFPQTDLETIAPIYTPQRSVPEVIPQPQTAVQPTVSPQHGGMTVQSNNSSTLSTEQLSKLHSELEIVAHSMSILGDMLSELKPGQEEPDDYALLNELTATCKEMQGRIVELIGRFNDDELTAELLRINDELNNLFLRHQRYEKNRGSTSGAAVNTPSSILGAAIGVPVAANVANTAATQQRGNEPLLIDLAERTDKLPNTFGQMGLSGNKPTSDADEFDMLAQSRTDAPHKSDLLKDIPSVNAASGSLGSPYKVAGESQPPVVSKATKDNEVHEMEAWLGDANEIEGLEETLTSTEFDKFLEERAAAAENLPSINNSSNAAANTSSSTLSSNQKKPSKKPHEEDLLAL